MKREGLSRRAIGLMLAAVSWWLSPLAQASGQVSVQIALLSESVERFVALAAGHDEHRLLATAAGYVRDGTLPPLDAARLAFDFMYDELERIERHLNALESTPGVWTQADADAYARAEQAFRSAPKDLVHQAMRRVLDGMPGHSPEDIDTAVQRYAHRIAARGDDVLKRWDALTAREWPKPVFRHEKTIDVDAVDLWTSFPAAVLLFIGGLLFLAAGFRWQSDPRGSWRFAVGGTVYGMVGYTLSYAPQAAHSFNLLFANGHEELAWGVLFFSLALPLITASNIASKNDLFPGLFYGQGFAMIGDAWREVLEGLRRYAKNALGKITRKKRGE